MTEAPGPDPDVLAGILSSEQVEEARTAAERFGGRDEQRLERAREATANRR